MIRIIPRQSFPYMIVTMILGTLNHFLYDWSGKNPVIALFTPVNESVWEHMKLLFFPFLLLSLIEYIIRRPDRARFFGSRLFCCLVRYAFHYHAFLWIQRRHRQVFRAD